MQSFLWYWLIPRLGNFFIRCIARTLRWDSSDIERLIALRQQHGRLLYAFWHNRLVMMPDLYVRSSKDRNLAVMVSRSRDGQVIAGIIERFGFKAIRGSTTRGGKAALREMVKFLKQDFDGAFTPDGPRGPRYEVQPGVVVLSHLTGLAILPICADYSHKLVLKSWDTLIIPYPFSRAVFRIGEPIAVGADANHNVLHEKVLELKVALDRLADRCALDLVSRSATSAVPAGSGKR